MPTRSKLKLRNWDPVDDLKSERDVVAYLEAALESGDPALFAAALGDVARARGMTELARSAALGRESLYKSLSAGGNPEFGTVLKVMGALGLQLHVRPASA